MRCLLLIVAIFFVPQILFSQNIKLVGNIGMEGGELFSYDMVLRPTDTPHFYRGEVKTYIIKNREVTADVEFSINPSEKTAYLKETKITSNLGFYSKVVICLVRAELTYDSENEVLKGPIITQTSGNNAYCARGHVVFTNGHEIKQLFNITQLQQPQKGIDSIVKETPIAATPTTKKPEPFIKPEGKQPPQTAVRPITIKKITEGQDEVILWKSQKLIFEIKDDNKVDGDRVTIHYNGKLVSENVIISETSKRYELDIGGNELNIIAITAVYAGSDPPCTALITLHDGTVTHQVIAYNDIGKKALIRIKRDFSK